MTLTADHKPINHGFHLPHYAVVTSCVRSGSLDFAPYKNSEDVQSENSGDCVNTCFTQIPGNSSREKGLLVTWSMQSRTSTVQRTTSQHRINAVNYAVRPPIGKEPQ